MAVQSSGRVTIYSRLRIQPLPILSSLQALAHSVKEITGHPHHDLGISLVSPKKIASMNKEYRNKRGTTDVLSFSAKSQSTDRFGSLQNDLGDLFVCPQMIAKDAAEERVSLEYQWRRILVHGVLHLAGYDHETDEDYNLMSAAEILALKRISEWENSDKNLVPTLFKEREENR